MQDHAPANANSSSNPNTPNNPNNSNVESRRMMFMSEKEKKEELILKQRAELAIKKGTAELDPEIEQIISYEIVQALQNELAKLLTEENHQRVHMNLPINRKVFNEDQYKFEIGGSADAASIDTPDKKISSKAPGRSSNTSKEKGKEDGLHKRKKKEDENGNTIVNIDDLFDLDNMSAFGNGSTDDDNYSADMQEDETSKGNEFAAELLYIMKLSVGLT